jgi:hypothetical protein
LFADGQGNLVPNWSFENISSCPSLGGDINKALPWFSASSSGSSTDLYNVCDNTFFGIPYNSVGFQITKSGNSYAGIGVYASTDYREYAEVKLIDSLRVGEIYCISFYVNPANVNTCYTSSIGARLSHDSLLRPSGNTLINATPDVLSANFITDTINWHRISGTYNCTSTSNYLTIGNFFNDANTTFSNSPNNMYYYLDDVSIVEVSNADASNDTSMCSGETIAIGGLPTFDAEYTWYELADSTNSSSIDSIHIAKPHISPIQTTTYVMWKRQCNVITTDTVIVTVNCVGIKQADKKQDLIIYPNPASESVTVSYAGNGAEIRVCDLLGKVVKRLSLNIGKTEIDLGGLNNGVYFILVMENDKPLATKKFVVQH